MALKGPGFVKEPWAGELRNVNLPVGKLKR